MKFSKFIINLMKSHAGLFFINTIIWSMIHGLPLITGYYLSTLVSQFNHNIIDKEGWVLFIIIITSLLFRSFMIFFGLFLDYTLIFRVDFAIKSKIISYLLNTLTPKSNKVQSGEILSRIRDDTEEIAIYLSWICDVCYRVLFLLIALIILFRVDFWSSVVVSIPLFISIYIVNFLIRKFHHYKTLMRKKQSIIGNTITQFFDKILITKFAIVNKKFFKFLDIMYSQRKKIAIKSGNYGFFLNEILLNITNISIALVIFIYSFYLKEKQDINLANLTLFITYIIWISAQMFFFGKSIARFKQAQIAFNRIKSYLQECDKSFFNKKKFNITRFNTILSLKNISFYYQNSNKGINDITFNIKKGSFNVITGPIGSGKTTLLEVILGIIPIKVGQIYWKGERIQSFGKILYPPLVSYCPQVPKFLQTSVRNNIVLGAKYDKEEYKRVLDMVALKNYNIREIKEIENFTEVFSGGELQKIALARMLYHKSEFYIIDDGTSSLDYKSAQNFWKSLRLLNKTFLVATLQPEIIRMADQVIILESGKIKNIQIN